MMLEKYTKQLGWAIAGTALMAGMLLLGQEASGDAPVLSLSRAVEIALENNRPVNIAKLDITKSKWEVAQTKTKRFPAITTYLFASGNLTTPNSLFPREASASKSRKTSTFLTALPGMHPCRWRSRSPSSTRFTLPSGNRSSPPILPASNIKAKGSHWRRM